MISYIYKMLAIFVISFITNSLTHADDFDRRIGHKRSYYVCPPNFVRLGNKCYYFSNETATWQDAYFHCKDFRSNLAIIKSSHQNKILRTALNKEGIEPYERWVGGYFDWQQKEWKWAPSGKPMSFQGFSQLPSEDSKMDWQKAILDPHLQYKWNTRSAIEKKHYICQTNLKNVNKREKKKLKKVYNADKNNELNVVPVPDIFDPTAHLPNDIDPNIPLPLSHKNHPLHYETNVIGQANFAKRVKEEKIRKKKLREEIKRKREQRRKEKEAKKKKRNQLKHLNNTLDGFVDTKSMKRKRNKNKNHDYDKSTEIPLHPQKIIEDLSDWSYQLLNETNKKS